MTSLDYLPPRPLGWTEHAGAILTSASFDPAVPTQTRLGAFSASRGFLDGFRMRRGDDASPVEGAPADIEDRFAGRWVYGGVLRPHYGHFLLESLSRAWFLRRHPELPILWHSATGKDVLMPWHREVFSLLGIPEGRFRFVMKPTQVDRIVLPDPGLVVGRWLDPLLARALELFPFQEVPRAGRRVWLSRSRLRSGLGKVEGENTLEERLASVGWTVLYPETLPVWQQLAALADAEEIAGFEGSAFHTLLLAAGVVGAKVTLYRRGSAAMPPAHEMIAHARRLRQHVAELPIAIVAGDGREQSAALVDPLDAARRVDPACWTPRPRRGAAAGVPDRAPDPQRIAFVHVPKTAGTSFTRALRVGWPKARIIGTQEQFDALPDSEIADLDLIAGHFRAWRLEQRRLPGFRAVTVLRDPLARLVSAYRFARRTIESGAPGDAAMRFAAQSSFADWAFSPYGRTQQHSQLYILGLEAPDLPRLVTFEKLLAQAETRLDRMLVGTVEELEAFLGYVYRRCGNGTTPPPALEKAMAAPEGGDGPDAEAPLTRCQHDVLMDSLRPDHALYAYGRDLMRRRLDEEPAGHAGERRGEG